MNGNLFKIVLVSVVAILLAIIGGIMSADGDPLSIVLAVSPFILAALFLMKGKVWYLWILIPILFLPIPSLRDYAPLLAYGITLPCYLWNVSMPRFPKMVAPVGKSGPLIISMISSKEVSRSSFTRLSIILTTAAMTSRRL